MSHEASGNGEIRADFRRLQAENRSCPHCGGAGLLIVFHPAWKGDRIGWTTWVDDMGVVRHRPFPAEIAAHCQCPVGGWIRARVEPEEQRRIPQVEDILSGRSKWQLEPPVEGTALCQCNEAIPCSQH